MGGTVTVVSHVAAATVVPGSPVDTFPGADVVRSVSRQTFGFVCVYRSRRARCHLKGLLRNRCYFPMRGHSGNDGRKRRHGAFEAGDRKRECFILTDALRAALALPEDGQPAAGGGAALGEALDGAVVAGAAGAGVGLPRVSGQQQVSVAVHAVPLLTAPRRLLCGCTGDTDETHGCVLASKVGATVKYPLFKGWTTWREALLL